MKSKLKAEPRRRPVSAAKQKLPTLAEVFAPLIGKAVGLPSDLAENHDHYLHGTAKRRPS